MSKGKIFVTGATGFIGSRVVRHLLAEGYEVRCLLRPTSQTRRLEGLHYERVTGDITDPTSLKDGMHGCKGVVHLASLSSWKDIRSAKMPKVVIDGSINVFDAAAEHGNLKTVYVSSSTAVNGTNEPTILTESSPLTLPANGRFVYAHAKKKVETIAMQRVATGQQITIVNPTEVYGPFDYDRITCGNLIDFARTSPILLAKGGTSIVYVDDVAAGITAAIEKGRNGERYILGSNNMHLDELAKTTLELLGLHKRIKILPRSLLTSMAWISKASGINMGFEPEVIPYAIRYWFVDNRKAKEELGINFRGAHDILAPTLRWMQDEKLV